MSNVVPYIPENAPFSLEQRAWLNGYLAGLFSRGLPRDLAGNGNGAALMQHGAGNDSAQPAQVMTLTILFGSQTGNAESLAKQAAKIARGKNFDPSVRDLGEYEIGKLPDEKNLLLITSTYGDGDPPDSAVNFWEALRGDDAPVLPELRFSVLALGDTNYEKFCKFGKDCDGRLEELGAQRVFPRADCDVDFDADFAGWLDGALAALQAANDQSAQSAPREVTIDDENGNGTTSGVASGGGASANGGNGAGLLHVSVLDAAVPAVPRTNGAIGAAFSRKHPFPARLLRNLPLNGAGSEKDTRHVTIDLRGSGLNYEAGDALGVKPCNCPQLVDEMLVLLGCNGAESVPGAVQGLMPLRQALLEDYELRTIGKELILEYARRSGDAQLEEIIADHKALNQYCHGREVIDLLLEYPDVKFAPEEFCGLLKKLQPRLYSVASSPKHSPQEAHITVGVLRYEARGRGRKGVCSNFLAARVNDEQRVPVFIQLNKNFRLPEDGSAAVIMVGPGTGIAPFRAFLYERRALGAAGKNWLIFGNPHAKTDFLYQDELSALRAEGVLTRLDLAFSRDQPEKIYVQHRLLENAAAVFAWLEAGAYFYVCGDANRMAGDVDRALHTLIERASGRDADFAAEYVKQLRGAKRYLRDVY